jgi:organic radical activating enzyme
MVIQSQLRSRSHHSTAPTYPIVEQFHSVQGEGAWAGVSAFFIRLGGCDVGCPWCDTKESWPQDHHPRQTVAALVAAAVTAAPALVVITGGEPLLHDLTAVTTALNEAGLRVHLETSGAYPLRGVVDWVTLSPKQFKPPHESIYAQAQELKVVVSDRTDLDWAETQAAQVPESTLCYLQPEWNTPTSPGLIFDYVCHHPRWRMSLQTHKLLGVR